MKLNRREKILAGAAGGLVLALAAWALAFSGDTRSRVVLRAARDRLAADVQSKRERVDAVKQSQQRLAQWERRALPSDLHAARSQYQTWLRGRADRAGFRQLNIDSSEGQARRKAYTLFSFTVRGRAGLGELTQFLYDFYSAGHLHQIRRMEIKPIEDSQYLDVTITVEAVSLPGADRKDELTKEPGSGLREVKLSAYRDPIVRRNLFVPYSPVIREERPSFDVARYAVVTGITSVDGRRELWLEDRTAGKRWRLHEGEGFQVGKIRGTVKSIGADSAVIEFDGRERQLALGNNLRSEPRGAERGPGSSRFP